MRNRGTLFSAPGSNVQQWLLYVNCPALSGPRRLHKRLGERGMGVYHLGNIGRQQLGGFGEKQLVNELGGIGPDHMRTQDFRGFRVVEYLHMTI